MSRLTRLLLPVLFGNKWTPKKVAGLKLWLRADNVAGADTDPVTTWSDLSGNNHHATEATNPPILKLNIANGHKVVRFNGTTQYLTIANHADFNLAAPWHAFLVIGPAAFAGTSVAILDKALAWRFYRNSDKPGFVTLGKTAYLPSKAWLTAARFDIVEHIFDASYDDTLVFNGWNKETMAGAADPTVNANNVTIGKQGTTFYDGDIAEILIGVFSSADIIRIRNYLADRYGVYVSADDVDAATASNAVAPLTTPTHDGHGEGVQPDVVYNAAGWNGYKYWMVFTSYPTDDRTEGLELLASADGDTWEVPAGLTNPILGEPSPAGYYNGDPCLFFSPDGLTLYCVYYYGNVVVPDKVRMTSSTDGVNWTAAVDLITGCDVDSVKSPSVVWDGSQYVMWTCNTTTSPDQLERRTCPTLTGTWSAAQVCTLKVTWGAVLVAPFHGHVKLYGGIYYGFYTNATTGYLLSSKDGITWQSPRQNTLPSAAPGAWDDYIYSGSILQSGANFDLIYSGRDNAAPNVYRIGRTMITGV